MVSVPPILFRDFDLHSPQAHIETVKRKVFERHRVRATDGLPVLRISAKTLHDDICFGDCRHRRGPIRANSAAPGEGDDHFRCNDGATVACYVTQFHDSRRVQT
jgi:hypothetical protein